MGQRLKWTSKEDALISQTHLTAKELAEILGITPHAVYQRRSKLGIKFWTTKKEPKPWASKWPKPYKFYRRYVLERDHWTCVYCGNPANQVDHVIPRHRGGTDLPSNLVASCASCNVQKGTACHDCPHWKPRHAI